MDDEALVRRLRCAIEVAAATWERAHEGLPRTPMTRTAAIPAAGILAAALLEQPEDDRERMAFRAARAIALARKAWEQTSRDTPGNPIAATAERTVIGILAAGILNLERLEDR